MKDEDRERLTEFLGDKWWPKVERLNMRSQFVKCDDNRTFATEPDMIALYKGLHGAGRWEEFDRYAGVIFIQQRHVWKVADYIAWLFCLSGEGYEERCQMVNDFLEVNHGRT